MFRINSFILQLIQPIFNGFMLGKDNIILFPPAPRGSKSAPDPTQQRTCTQYPCSGFKNKWSNASFCLHVRSRRMFSLGQAIKELEFGWVVKDTHRPLYHRERNPMHIVQEPGWA